MNLKQELTDADIQELGMKSGLEIHQQLEGRKLFCTCPTLIRDDQPDFVIKRLLRASAGESGEIDVAAAAEMKKQKQYFYEGYVDTTCLVELDEAPPKNISEDAITAALQTAKFLHMHVVDQLRVMRKMVVNGSNTSGFQRTSLVATNGYLETELGIVGIESLCLEEDSCKDVEQQATYTRYNLSRLGIPLLEVATAPDLRTPDHIAQTAQQIGMLLRSLPNVKRGLGTIRQDVNVSIRDGVRVEIKGAQDLKLIPSLVRNECLRQYNLLQLFAELKNRHASVGQPTSITSLNLSSSKVIRSALDDGGAVIAVGMKGFGGLIGQEIQPGRRLGSEYSDYAKLLGVKGLFHSDELPKYGITQEEKNAVFAELGLSLSIDAFMLIAAEEQTALRALHAACERAQEFNLRKEVRVARPDGTTTYMRPMPGPGRMYPETDIPGVLLHPEQVALPKLLSEQITELAQTYGIAQDIAKRLLRDGIDFKQLHEQLFSLKPTFIIDCLYSLPSLVHKKYSVQPSIEDILLLLTRLHHQEITKDALEPLAVLLAKQESIDWSAYRPVAIEDIADEIRGVVAQMPGAPKGAVVGKIMTLYKGRIDGAALLQFLNSLF